MPRLPTADRLAEHMAEGCPSIIEAARRMRISVSTADEHWRKIRKRLGRQAV